MLAILALSAVALPVLACALAWLLGRTPTWSRASCSSSACLVAVVSTMWVGMTSGDMALGLGTLLVSTVLSPVTIPLTLKVLLGQTVQVDVATMMFDMLVEIALPALAGVAINDLTRGWASGCSRPRSCRRLASPSCWSSSQTPPASLSYMTHLTPTLVAVALFICAFSSAGYVVGFAAALLREPRADAVTTTFQVGMRNISAGAVLAQQFFPPEVMFPVVAGTLSSSILASSARSRWAAPWAIPMPR